MPPVDETHPRALGAYDAATVVVALDAMGEAEAIALARTLSGVGTPGLWGFKINDLLLKSGVDVIPRLKAYGRVFCDPKLFDIPNTVGNQVRVLCRAGADLITLHCAGGAAMVSAAREAAEAEHQAGSDGAGLLGVTVLTSFDDQASQASFGRAAAEQVTRFAAKALEWGLDGVVCAPGELGLLDKVDPARRMLRVTPGVRPDWHGQADDQRRTSTPRAALEAGAGLLVIGRPITHAEDPLGACQRILEEIAVARPAGD